MKQKDDQERRHDQRVNARIHGLATFDDQSVETYVLNLSENGTLLAVLGNNKPALQQHVKISLAINPAETIELEGKVVHSKEHMIGVNYDDIYGPSLARLKGLQKQL